MALKSSEDTPRPVDLLSMIQYLIDSLVEISRKWISLRLCIRKSVLILILIAVLCCATYYFRLPIQSLGEKATGY